MQVKFNYLCVHTILLELFVLGSKFEGSYFLHFWDIVTYVIEVQSKYMFNSDTYQNSILRLYSKQSLVFIFYLAFYFKDITRYIRMIYNFAFIIIHIIKISYFLIQYTVKQFLALFNQVVKLVANIKRIPDITKILIICCRSSGGCFILLYMNGCSAFPARVLTAQRVVSDERSGYCLRY